MKISWFGTPAPAPSMTSTLSTAPGCWMTTVPPSRFSRWVRDIHIGQARLARRRGMSTASVMMPRGSGPIVVAPSLSPESEGWSPGASTIGLPLASNCRRWNCGARMGSPPAETESHAKKGACGQPNDRQSQRS